MDDQNQTNPPVGGPVGDQGGVQTPPAQPGVPPVEPEAPSVPPVQEPVAPSTPEPAPIAPQPGTDQGNQGGGMV